MKLLRYADLVEREILNNRMTLKRWIESSGFPPGFLLGPNTRVWDEADIIAWLEYRKANE